MNKDKLNNLLTFKDFNSLDKLENKPGKILENKADKYLKFWKNYEIVIPEWDNKKSNSKANINDKFILTEKGYDLLNEKELKTIILKKLKFFTIESYIDVLISDKRGKRKKVREVYCNELPGVNMGLENIHWKLI